MRQSGRVIALSRPTCFNSQNTCVGSSPVCKCDHRRNKETSSAHPFSKEELGILGRESATLVMRNRAKLTSCLAFAAATLLKANGERIFCARCGAVRRDSDTACALLLRPHSSADAPGTFLALRFRADQGASRTAWTILRATLK